MMYSLLEKAVTQFPESLALVTSDKQTYTYQMLLTRVHQWMHYLIQLQVEARQRIGFMSLDNDMHLFFYLALDGLGAVYVPLDAEMPTEQLKSGLTILNLDHLFVTTSEQLTGIFLDRNAVLSFPSNLPDKATPNEPDNCSYVMSSSGSTGDKKWIPINGAGLAYWARVEKDLLQLTSKDKVLSTRSPAFDARISEYLRAFSSGATLYLMSHLDRKDMTKIVETCQQEKITTLLMVPSQLESTQFANYLPKLAQSGLKHLIVTGEACNWALAKLCKQLDIKLWNAYGPTEATFGVSLLEITQLISDMLDESKPVPIGKPVAPVHYLIEDGCLLVSSPYLSPGYLGNIEKQNLFSFINHQGITQKVFNTGDLMTEEGNFLIYHGRKSLVTECKIGGVKVSPLDIESIMNQYNPQHLQSVVVIKTWLERLKPIAYIYATAPIDNEDFLKYLKSRLSIPEMPVCFTISEFPRLVPSDKIDRNALIALRDNPNNIFLKNNESLDVENDSLINTVLRLWEKLFKMAHLTPQQDFFALGGDSITANELVMLIQQTIDSSYRYSDFLSLTQFTPAAIAHQLKSRSECEHNLPIATLLINSAEANQTFFMLPPLLGEGCFTYKKLAESYTFRFTATVYGLSSPTILPETMTQEAEQFAATIQSIQPHGSYHLIGFSYGATLASEVARVLVRKGEKVKTLELIDGFPPIVLQKISAPDHARLLYSLLHFILSVIEKKPYKETVSFPVSDNQQEFETHITTRAGEFSKNSEPISINPANIIEVTDYFEKMNQIRYVFFLIFLQLKNNLSKHLVNIAERHLLFMLSHRMPHQRLAITPRVYQSDQNQDYWRISKTITGLAPRSPEPRYAYWNNYFFQTRRNGFSPQCTHLQLLKDWEATPYWRTRPDLLHNLDVPASLLPFYTSEKKQGNYLYNLHFIPQLIESKIVNALAQWDISAKKINFDTSYELLRENDAINEVMTSFQFSIEPSKKALIDTWLQSIGCPEKSILNNEVKTVVLTSPPDFLYLTVFLRSMPILDLSFALSKCPLMSERELVIPARFLQAHVSNKSILSFAFIEMEGDNLWEIIRNVSFFIGQFIALMNNQFNKNTSTKPSYVKETNPNSLAHTFFDTKVINSLIKKYQLPNTTQSSLEKALRMAACNNQIADLDLLIPLVKNINARDPNPRSKKTALHWAHIKEHHQCIKHLLDAGADPSIWDAMGAPAL